MKKFFYLCAALLCLSLAFHFGYTTARAQAPGNPVVGVTINANNNVAIAVTENGDTYQSINGNAPWTKVSNVFGAPTPAMQESWGQVKSRYAPSHGPTTQTPTNR